ncbi:hypothetical protein [Actinoplanes sp. NBRC 103695]|uniref:hypothetical protein n=1 Tax=Actinoplanes sp. NBRC 103695 TaxID=3032202 RepID=UPI002553C6CA|nr:hypothetical protein [Actinoplanes sp. NBRC 103695]
MADGLAELGIDITPQYVQQLRTGTKTKPSLDIVHGLGKVFGLSTSYFTDDDAQAQRIQDQIAFVIAMRDGGVRQLALRASELDPEARQWVMETVERELRLRREGNPPKAGPKRGQPRRGQQ